MKHFQTPGATPFTHAGQNPSATRPSEKALPNIASRRLLESAAADRQRCAVRLHARCRSQLLRRSVSRVVIAGAGAELALQMAQRGVNVLLLAADKLAEVADRIANAHNSASQASPSNEC